MVGRSTVRSNSLLMKLERLKPSRAARAFRVLCMCSGTSLTWILGMSRYHMVWSDPRSLLSGCRRSSAYQWSLLQILVVPRQVALHPIPDIARPGDAVLLVGIDDELRIDTQAPERLIHLLAALHRNVEIALAAKEQRRRRDAIRVQERIGDLHVRLPRLRVPGRSDFVVVLNDVLVGPVEGDRK